MTMGANTRESPGPDWIERIRSHPPVEMHPDLPYPRTALWPLLCDVVEQAERWSTFIPALAALRDEVERDG